MTDLHFDYETFSPVDITKCGHYRYAEEAEIILLAYAFDDEPVVVVDVMGGESIPQRFLDALIDPQVVKYAHNMGFERVITKRCLGIEIPLDQVRCTSVWAAHLGLPASLGPLSEVLKLGDKAKLKIGKALIRKFCVPCKPTKKNGQRTRNLPEHFPEDWVLFKEYNRQDVEAEREVHRCIGPYPMPEKEWQLYQLDQRVNDEGIRVELRLVSNAIRLADSIRERLFNRAQEITGLDNPNSRNQLIEWLDTEDIYTTDLTKKTVEAILGGGTTNEKVTELLQIRQQLAKASVSKYEAMARAVCRDGRLRGMFKFNGAGRTGRWAGQIVQMQNLPSKGLIKDIELARNLLLAGSFETLELLYADIPNVLSSLIRTAFLPDEGDLLPVADFSAIEARKLAWLAHEKWRLELFASGGKLYEMAAERMFNLPPGSVGKKDPMRQRGKVAELACFSPDTLVLTNAGAKAIVDVSETDLLWDGVEWITHKGLVDQGLQETISLDGVEMTPNQLVFSNGSWLEASQLASSPSTLCQALATGSENLPSSTLHGAGKGRELSVSAAAEPSQAGSLSTICEPGELLGATSAQRSKLSGPGSSSTQSTPTPCQTLSTEGDSSTGLKRPSLDATRLTTSSTSTTAAEESMCAKSGEPVPEPSCSTFKSYPAGISQSSKWTESMSTEATSPETYASYPGGRTPSTREKSETCKPGSPSLKRVYDIAHAGPRNRFTIVTDSGYLLVHNCGYQGWENALITMGALDMGLKLEELAPIASAWRKANPAIEDYWGACEKAALAAVRGKTRVPVLSRYQDQPLVQYESDGKFLMCILPSGRRLYYAKPRVGRNDRGNLAVSFEGVNGKSKKWGRSWLYGGLYTENISQASARDCLADALLACDRHPLLRKIRLHVHDELGISAPAGQAKAALAELEKIMAIAPAWAPGLPLKGDGFITQYYRKDDD